MKYLFLIFCCSIFTLSMYSQSLDELKKQREKTEKEIEFTNKLLQKTEANTKNSLNKITVIGKQISNRKSLINTINQEVNFLDADIVQKKNNIFNLEQEINLLKKDYERAVYHTWKTKNSNNRLMYVFSGKDLGQVYRRVRYLHEFSAFRKQQGELLLVMRSDLEKELNDLETVKEQKVGLLDSKTQEQYRLVQEQNKQGAYVKELQKKQRSLKKQLAQQQEKMSELNKVIERIIAEEIRKSNAGKKDSKAGKFMLTPEEQLVSDKFDKNRGKLPWPVEQGIIISKYGVHKHEVEKTVTMDNPGIDIQTAQDALVRSVFQGVVTGVYPLPGYNMGVIIRHGEYLTFYANLSEVYVSKGEEVTLKQSIGKIFNDETNGKSVLHFEVYKGSTKNNPEYWIAR